MNKKILIIIFSFCFMALIFAEDAIPESVIREGERKFNGGRDIFKGTLSDPDAWKGVRDEAVARINAIFANDCVGTILKTRDNKWAVTITIKDARTPRKTVIDREKMVLGGNEYLVIAGEKGIRVIDMKTKYDLAIDKIEKRR